MSIDRFIVRKLETCRELTTRSNLVKLLQIRIAKVWEAEERSRKG
ncbi:MULTISPECIES: hypothetical protein [Paenibacillus]|nr:MULTISPECIES: hypothetical protein [Paenibacillus]